MQAAPPASAEPEVLEMDEPRKPNTRFYILSGVVFVVLTLLFAANLDYLSELVKEDREEPAVTPILTRSYGWGQKVKFTVGDDRALPVKVHMRVHFWKAADDAVNKTKWRTDLRADMEFSHRTTVIETLPYLPDNGGTPASDWYTAWYVWVEAVDFSGKKNSTERCVFPSEWDAGW
jgi:hypothetical protein